MSDRVACSENRMTLPRCSHSLVVLCLSPGPVFPSSSPPLTVNHDSHQLRACDLLPPCGLASFSCTAQLSMQSCPAWRTWTLVALQYAHLGELQAGQSDIVMLILDFPQTHYWIDIRVRLPSCCINLIAHALPYESIPLLGCLGKVS